MVNAIIKRRGVVLP